MSKKWALFLFALGVGIAPVFAASQTPARCAWICMNDANRCVVQTGNHDACMAKYATCRERCDI